MTSVSTTARYGQTYPLARAASDERFSFGLTYDIAKVIEAAGYPPVRGADIIELQQALYRFLYTEDGAR